MLSLLKPVLMPFQGSCGHAAGCRRIKKMLGCWAAICWSRGEFNTGQGYTAKRTGLKPRAEIYWFRGDFNTGQRYAAHMHWICGDLKTGRDRPGRDSPESLIVELRLNQPYRYR